MISKDAKRINGKSRWINGKSTMSKCTIITLSNVVHRKSEYVDKEGDYVDNRERKNWNVSTQIFKTEMFLKATKFFIMGDKSLKIFLDDWILLLFGKSAVW